MRSPWMVTCSFSKEKGYWILRWKKPFTESGGIKTYLVRVVDDLGVSREMVVDSKYSKVKIKWLRDTRVYQAEVVAQYEDGIEETSLAVPILQGKKKSDVDTYTDEKTGKRMIRVPYLGKLYEVFAAKEVYWNRNAYM